MTATFRRQLGSNAFADAAAAAAAGAAEKRRKGEAKERALEEQREEEKAVRAPERRPRSSRPAIPTKKLDCFDSFLREMGLMLRGFLSFGIMSRGYKKLGAFQ